MEGTKVLLTEETRLEEVNNSVIEMFSSDYMPLVDNMLSNDFLRSLNTRSRIVEYIHEGNVTALVRFGFPEDIVSVMIECSHLMPDVLGTVSHPARLDLYRLSAEINCAIVLSRIGRGALGTIRFPYYDSTPLGDKSVLNPFFIGKDVFKLRGRSTYDVVEISDIVVSLESSEEEILSKLYNMITPTLFREVKNQVKTEQRGAVLSYIKEMMHYRFSNLVSCIKSSQNRVTIGRFLMDFQDSIITELLVLGSGDSLDQALGFEKPLLISGDLEYLNVIRKTFVCVFDSRGCGGLARIFPPGDLALVEISGRIGTLSKCKKGDFCLRFDCNKELFVSLEEGMSLLINAKVFLSKAEMVVIALNGITIHMGSEYDLRNIILSNIGLSNQALSYMRYLRLGKDKRHGIPGIMIAVGKGLPLSLPLLYLVLGPKGIIDFLKKKIGKSSNSDLLTEESLRTLFARNLIRDSKDHLP
jgi:hypothetical protein